MWAALDLGSNPGIQIVQEQGEDDSSHVTEYSEDSAGGWFGTASPGGSGLLYYHGTTPASLTGHIGSNCEGGYMDPGHCTYTIGKNKRLQELCSAVVFLGSLYVGSDPKVVQSVQETDSEASLQY